MSKVARVLRGRLVLVALGGGAVAVGARLGRRYRRDLDAARARLAAVDHRVIRTPLGAVQYAKRGAGEPVLVIHGILQGCDGGLLSARDMVADRRVIAPSRFGYLESTLPAGATPADQADAFVLLLDNLGIGQTDVIGISAGTTSALQFALRHPDRVKHLVIVSGSLPGSRTAAAPPRPARLFYRDLPMWVLKVVAPTVLAGLMGVPHGFPRNAEEACWVSEMVDSIFPVGPRADGAIFDAFVSNPDVSNCNLEALRVPTMIVHAQDDPLASYDAACRAAGRVRGAVLVSIRSGGHLMLGQAERVRGELAAFLATPIAA